VAQMGPDVPWWMGVLFSLIVLAAVAWIFDD
jgi:hypothetical protein